MTIQEAMQLAIQHHQAGQLARAEELCRQILFSQPNNGVALHLLGVLACQTGHVDAAIELIGKAIAIHPHVSDFHNNLGNALMSKGDWANAAACYQRALELRPDCAESHNNLGNLVMRQKDWDRAIACYQRATTLRANFAEAYNNLGTAWKNKGQLEKALASFQRAVACKPDFAVALENSGIVLLNLGRPSEAVDCFRRALAMKPWQPELHVDLSNALKDCGDLDGAIAACRAAVAAKGDYAEACNNLGNLLKEKGQLEEALAAAQRAVALKPIWAEAHCNLGNILKAQGRLEDAIAAYRQAVALQGDLAEAHFELALALLLRGDWPEGWSEHEWRWKVRELQVPQRFAQAPWNGQELCGKTILLHAEQGYGDTIQFMRYVALLARRGGKVLLEVPQGLLRLSKRMAGADEVLERGASLPCFDYHCPLLSLPLALGTTLDTVPAAVPYLLPDPELADAWRRKPALAGSEIKVGLAWAGNPQHRNDRNRSIALRLLSPLAAIQGVEFHSLQRGPAAAQAADASLPVVNWCEQLADFADAAALLAQLDLVICVDTAIAHLAGAMGRPVWVLLPFVPDWRWLLHGDDNPWYPTMRLFRQTTRGDWPGVIARVKDALTSLCRSGTARAAGFERP